MQLITAVLPILRQTIQRENKKKYSKLQQPKYLHSLSCARQRAGFVDEVRVLHVLCKSLKEAQWLVEYNWHCDLGQLLMHK